MLIMLGAIYIVLASRADDTPISDRDLRELVREASAETGLPRPLVAEEIRAELRQAEFERRVNKETLAQLLWMAPFILLALLALSLVIAYIVAGLVLAPVTRIVARARVLASEGPDLSGRIRLGGPDDELRELADTLDDLLDRTEGALESQKGFLADASHELRTPLAVAQTNLDVALHDPDPSVEDLRQATTVARDQIGRLGRMVGDLLTLERGPGRRSRSVSLRPAAEQAVADLSARAADHSARMTIVPGPEANAIIDPDDLARMITNLLENAIVHNPEGGEVRLKIGGDADSTFLSVTDQGPGVPPGHEARIFDRFHRASRADGGTGLGLAIVRELAEAAGGSISLEAGSPAGATFLLRLPRAGGAPGQ